MVKRKGNRLGKGLEAFFGDEAVNGAGADTKKTAEKEKNTINGKSKGKEPHILTEDTSVEKSSEKDSENTGEPNTEAFPKDSASGEIMVRLSLIEPNSSQPRKQFEEEKLEELSRSIKKYGILQPLIVKRSGEGFEIIAGERRFRAAHAAGLREVPVIIREYDRQQSMEIAIIENIQRSDLNPIEEAKAYQTLIEEFDLKQEEVAERVSKNRSTITNMLRLLRLEESIQLHLIEGRLSSGHARALLSLENQDIQKKIAEDIILKNLSVRETEKLVKAQILPRKKKKDPIVEGEERDYSIFYKEYEEKIRSIMGTGVRINRKDKNKGRIEIEYYSAAELERIMELFSGIR